MRKLFIDSNIYLGFFNSNRQDFKKLLASLVELKEKVFITHQIIDEVNRNKLKVFNDSLENYIKGSNFNKISLPEHLDNDEKTTIANWNTRRKKLEEEAYILNQELSTLIGTTLSEIYRSEDKVSLQLQQIFFSPLKVNDTTYRKARIRREMGNPPGKKDDPLGDQFNWVQVLEYCKNISSLWIITNDQDYYIEHNGQLFLNPLLYKELKNINPAIEISVYNKLGEALKDFNKTEKIRSLPPKQVLDEIAQAEPIPIIKAFQSSKHKFYGGGHASPIKCPSCNAESTFKTGEYRPSKFGFITYQFQCSNCGYWHDTGDYGDEGFSSTSDQYHS